MTIMGLVAGTTSYGGNEISLDELIDPYKETKKKTKI